ncbi:LuxR family transcriptional regulator [Verrucosispora sp. SN26_14.1]|uniref:helix-turn-helix transcriptional regulator n=1 Tax=Verrucosispora sp. SN26_14.1 TaxID=2527879 RepID=UPI001034DA78|nr:LuxR family transcriptional regulator [Verrucosispora sp. SN26_14.1]TBL45043.1 LuxR family transcriptional regulator [Verrucosispora sp. SN26_14.1]
MTLLERDHEQLRIRDHVAGLDAGTGAIVLVEGAPGIGKSALLAEVCRTAQGQEVGVLTAHGGELEQDMPFGVVRQLFEPALHAVAPADRADLFTGAARLASVVFDSRPGSPDTSVGDVVHALHWLCANLAERRPLLLVVDDVHSADEASLRFLSHLSRRVTHLPILLLLATRPAWRHDRSPTAQVLSGVSADILPLAPLGREAVAALVRGTLSPGADESFCEACATVSGGNPFLLTEAINALRVKGVAARASEVHHLGALRSDFITRSVLARITSMGPQALHLARAVAVLGSSATLHRVATLADIAAGPTRPDTDANQTAHTVDLLVREAVLAPGLPLDFVHPLLRTAVYTDISAPFRAHLHKAAALLLATEQVAPEHIAPHLLACEPTCDPWVADALHSAAHAASGRSAIENAVRFLERAMIEPPAPSVRTSVSVDLIRALVRANRLGDAGIRLQSLLNTPDTTAIPAETAVDLGTQLVIAGQHHHGGHLLQYAQSAARDSPEIAIRVLAAAAFGGLTAMDPPHIWIHQLEQAVSGLSATADTDRMVYATLAFLTAATGDRTADEVTRMATVAATGPLPARGFGLLVNLASAALAICGQNDDALQLLDAGIDAARQDGDLTTLGYLSVLRSHTAIDAGRLMEAEADGQTALEIYQERPEERPLAAAVLVDALVARGETAAAQDVLTTFGLETHLPLNWLISHFFHLARARLRLHQHRPADALVDLAVCGDALTAAGYTNPAFAGWRFEKVQAHLALGDTAQACALAAEEVELARRFRSPRSLGTALRSAAAVAKGAERLALLREAVTILESTSAPLHHAHALFEYGAALRRNGERSAAQEPLRRALHHASRCGAQLLTRQATDELLAAGARPRRHTLSGPEALTAQELRVAQLAAAGATNRDIAQRLFVTRRTVEIHLTNAYRKLNITSRGQLQAALVSSD